jgi:type IV secretory pathway component VirB8
VTIHNSAGTVIGHGFMEMTAWFISQKDEDSSIYTLLGGALLDNRRHIADLSRRNPNWFLKLQSIFCLILIAIVIFLIFVLLPLYIIYVLVMAYKQQPTQDFSQLPPKP